MKKNLSNLKTSFFSDNLGSKPLKASLINLWLLHAKPTEHIVFILFQYTISAFFPLFPLGNA